MAAADGFHVPYERLDRLTIEKHFMLDSLQEELEAVDWYRQRAADCDDADAKAILLHNAREEIEHAVMVLEWLRRNDKDFDRHLRTYLFTDKPIIEVEHEAEHPNEVATVPLSEEFLHAVETRDPKVTWRDPSGKIAEPPPVTKN